MSRRCRDSASVASNVAELELWKPCRQTHRAKHSTNEHERFDPHRPDRSGPTKKRFVATSETPNVDPLNPGFNTHRDQSSACPALLVRNRVDDSSWQRGLCFEPQRRLQSAPSCPRRVWLALMSRFANAWRFKPKRTADFLCLCGASNPNGIGKG